eukprot:gb/GFBE01035897.1/.p1 GENE.gb/GFBE01035897.1/~~gb/GFBE01035897.1/.p1  ORF type:complete len:306 (+),score=60.65 gb/GFBE01035897.1/:1-918(+)
MSESSSAKAGDLKILEKIGTGRHGDVHKGLYKGTQAVAVKSFRLNEMSDDRHKSMAREINILFQVKHPHIVAYVSTFTEFQTFRILVEFCAGGNLFDQLRSSQKLAWLQKTKIARDVAEAMRHLHSLDPKIIHRELSSKNLLLDQRIESSKQVPHIKVADFGSARYLDHYASPLTFGVGSVQWMAPEIIDETGPFYSEKCDVYSYAMVLYELLSESEPFPDSGARLAICIVSGQRPSMELVPKDAPEVLLVYMARCWDPEPAERPEFTQICIGLEVLAMDEERLAALDAFADSCAAASNHAAEAS